VHENPSFAAWGGAVRAKRGDIPTARFTFNAPHSWIAGIKKVKTKRETPQESWWLFKAVPLGNSSIVGGDLTIFVVPCFNEMARRVHVANDSLCRRRALWGHVLVARDPFSVAVAKPPARENRLFRWKKLQPASTQNQDGELGENAEDMIVGYALASRGYFQTITDTIEDAQLIAKRAGREHVTAKDLKAAIHEWRAPSDAALVRVFDSKPEGRRRYPRDGAPPAPEAAPIESPVIEPLNAPSRGVNDGFSSPESVRRPRALLDVPSLTG